MKDCKNCPFCGDPMINNFPPAEDMSCYVTKYCNRRVDHNVKLIVDMDDDKVTQMGIDLGNGYEAIFLFSLKAIWIQGIKKDKSMMVLPFFEPDLSNYRRLVDKVKTYLVFS
jgi:hypothetical protein